MKMAVPKWGDGLKPTMPKGPRGEKRPGAVIGAAIMVAKIATGEKHSPAAELGRKGGSRLGEDTAERGGGDSVGYGRRLAARSGGAVGGQVSLGGYVSLGGGFVSDGYG